MHGFVGKIHWILPLPLQNTINTTCIVFFTYRIDSSSLHGWYISCAKWSKEHSKSTSFPKYLKWRECQGAPSSHAITHARCAIDDPRVLEWNSSEPFLVPRCEFAHRPLPGISPRLEGTRNSDITFNLLQLSEAKSAGCARIPNDFYRRNDRALRIRGARAYAKQTRPTKAACSTLLLE